MRIENTVLINVGGTKTVATGTVIVI